MDSSCDDRPSAAGNEWPAGPVVLGVAWEPSEHLIRAGASLAARLDAHLICAYRGPGQLPHRMGTRRFHGQAHRWIRPSRVRQTSPPAMSANVLQAILGPPGEEWSFRVLNGAVAQALGRLAESTDASLLIVGGQRPGRLAAMERMLEGSVECGAGQTAIQARPGHSSWARTAGR